MIIEVETIDVGKRFDVFLSEKNKDFTRSRIKHLIDEGLATVNGKKVKSGYLLKAGDNVSADFPAPVHTDILAENIPLDIVYEDDDLLVVNKPQGMTVHPAGSLRSGTLVNALMYNVKNLSGIGGKIRPGIVHRIDKDTSGLLVVAKNDFSHLALQKQIQDKTCHREYVAVTHGVWKEETGEIENFLARGKTKHEKIFVVPMGQGRLAKTDYKVLRQSGALAVVWFNLHTGRTHQIRVHASTKGHAIVGDKLYGIKEKYNLAGQLLHAYKLQFVHPRTEKLMTFTCPLPKYFSDFLKAHDLEICLT